MCCQMGRIGCAILQVKFVLSEKATKFEKKSSSYFLQEPRVQAEWLACQKSRDPILNAVLLFSKTVC